MNEAHPNIHKIYTFRFFRDFILVMPIIVPFYLSNNITPSQIFMIQSIFSLTLLSFEVPSGYFADVGGRKRSLILGSLFISTGWLIYGLSASFAFFALAEFILAVGFSLCSGTESALIYDSLLEAKKEDQYQVIEGKGEFYTRIGTAVSAVLGGFLASGCLRLPFYVSIGTGLIMFVCAWLMSEPKRSRPLGKNPFMDILKTAKYSLTHPFIFPVILYSSAILMTGIIGIWGYFFFLGNVKLSIITNGILFAVFQAVSALGAVYSKQISLRLGEDKAFFCLYLIPVVFLLLGFFDSRWMILLSLVNALLWGFSTPLFLNLINQRVESDYRATILSVSSMVGRCSFVVLSPLFGFLIERRSLGAAFIALGGYLLVLSVIAHSLIQRQWSMGK